MHTRLSGLTVAILAAVTGLSGTAHAGIFATGPAFGGPSETGGTITCRIFNNSAYGVNIVKRQIFTNTGASLTLSSDTCTATLASTQMCAFAASITGPFAFSCRVYTSGTDGEVTGVAEVQNSGNAVLLSTPLQK